MFRRSLPLANSLFYSSAGDCKAGAQTWPWQHLSHSNLCAHKVEKPRASGLPRCRHNFRGPFVSGATCVKLMDLGVAAYVWIWWLPSWKSLSASGRKYFFSSFWLDSASNTVWHCRHTAIFCNFLFCHVEENLLTWMEVSMQTVLSFRIIAACAGVDPFVMQDSRVPAQWSVNFWHFGL